MNPDDNGFPWQDGHYQGKTEYGCVFSLWVTDSTVDSVYLEVSFISPFLLEPDSSVISSIIDGAFTAEGREGPHDYYQWITGEWTNAVRWEGMYYVSGPEDENGYWYAEWTGE